MSEPKVELGTLGDWVDRRRRQLNAHIKLYEERTEVYVIGNQVQDAVRCWNELNRLKCARALFELAVERLMQTG